MVSLVVCHQSFADSSICRDTSDTDEGATSSVPENDLYATTVLFGAVTFRDLTITPPAGSNIPFAETRNTVFPSAPTAIPIPVFDESPRTSSSPGPRSPNGLL